MDLFDCMFELNWISELNSPTFSQTLISIVQLMEWKVHLSFIRYQTISTNISLKTCLNFFSPSFKLRFQDTEVFSSCWDLTGCGCEGQPWLKGEEVNIYDITKFYRLT